MFSLNEGIRPWRPLFSSDTHDTDIVFTSELSRHGGIDGLMVSLRQGGADPQIVEIPKSITQSLTKSQSVFAIKHQPGDKAHDVYRRFGLQKGKMLIP